MKLLEAALDFWNWVLNLFRPGRLEREMNVEIENHLALEKERSIRNGMTENEARKASLRQFGHVDGLKEECRDSWKIGVARDWIRNLKFGLRLSTRYMSSSILASIALGLGIGISIVIYTVSSKVVSIVVSGGLDLSERHVVLEWETGREEGEPINSLDFKAIQEKIESLEEIMAIQQTKALLYPPGKKDSGKYYKGALVTSNMFEVLNVQPHRGRVFSKSDTYAYGVAEIVISSWLWSELFSLSEEAVGSTLIVDRQELMIVGIMPDDFIYRDSAFWMTNDWKEFDGRQPIRAPKLDKVIGLLQEGVSVEQARIELDVIASNLAAGILPANEKRDRVRVSTYWSIFTSQAGILIFSIAMGICWLTLIIACSNTFNVIITRTAARSHELAVRSSLGAKRRHLIFQVIFDGLALAVGGTLLGLFLTIYGLNIFNEFFAPQLAISGTQLFELEPSVILYIAGAAIFSGIAASFIPAWRASKIDAFAVLKDDSKSLSSVYIGWLSKIVVISQVAFSAVMIFVGLVLFIQVDRWKKTLELPYNTDSILMAGVNLLRDEQFKDKQPQDLINFYGNIKRRLEGVPGIGSVAITSVMNPLVGSPLTIEFEAREGDRTKVRLSKVSPNYLDVFDTQPLQGRMLSEVDTLETTPVCVVDKRFVEYYCRETDPVGMRIKMSSEKPRDSKRHHRQWYEIVGVVPNLYPKKIGSLQQRANVFVSYAQLPVWSPKIVLKADDAGAPRFRQAMRQAINDLVPASKSGGSQTLEEQIRNGYREIEFGFKVGLVIAGALLAISFISLYSIIKFTTSLRRKEFGIRMAIGSNDIGIVKTITGPWLIIVGSGLLVGYLCLLGFISIVFNGQSVPALVGLSQSIGEIYLRAVVLIGICALISIGIPVWSATRVDPIEAIRAE